MNQFVNAFMNECMKEQMYIWSNGWMDVNIIDPTK